MTGHNPIDTSSTPTTRTTVVPSTASPPRLTTLILLSAIAVLPMNAILPSLPHIAATFRADFALVNLAVAGYAIATALTNLVAGAISDRYGRRPVALIAISIFIAASVGCALATTIGVFLVFRAMQASIATCFSIVLVIINETSAERKAASKLGYLAMGWAIAPMLGPLFGGFFDELFGWRAIVVVFAILGIGNGLTMPAANTGVHSVNAEIAGTAAGLAAAMSIAGGALVVSIAGVFVAQSATVYALFWALLISASLAMLAALYAAFLDRPIAEPIS